jgi:multidrug resistance efflux pump
MRKGVITLAIVIALIAGAGGIGWLYFRANPAAWDDFVAEMQGETTGSSSPRPARPPAKRTGALVASGTIEAEDIVIATEMGGRVVELFAGEGDRVDAGDALLQLDRAALLAHREGAEAGVAQAQAAVEVAEAQLAAAMSGARAQEIAAAEGAVVSAQGSVAVTVAMLDQSEIAAEMARASVVNHAQGVVEVAMAALAQAEGMLDAAEANLARAQAELARLQAGARPEELAVYQALLAQAEAELRYATGAYRQLIDHKIGGVAEEQTRFQMEAVQSARDAAQAQLDLVRAGATSNEIAAGRAGVSAAQAQVAIARAGVEAAEAPLDQAEIALGTADGQVRLAEAQVAAARSQVAVVDGQLAQAGALRSQLQAGATAEEIAVLEAQVAQAEAMLASAGAALRPIDIQLERTTLHAPVGGILTEQLVHSGELAAPGGALFLLADLDEVTLTVYVPEANLGRVSLGQPVEVAVDAFDEVFAGLVSHIASQAEFTPRNVQTQEERVHMVFAIKIRLDNADHRLKPGMPADAVFADGG